MNLDSMPEGDRGTASRDRLHLKPIAEIPSGTRVRKRDAIFGDFAFGRAGWVVRDTWDGQEHQGVLFDGGRAVIEYPGDTLLLPIADGD